MSLTFLRVESREEEIFGYIEMKRWMFVCRSPLNCELLGHGQRWFIGRWQLSPGSPFHSVEGSLSSELRMSPTIIMVGHGRVSDAEVKIAVCSWVNVDHVVSGTMSRQVAAQAQAQAVSPAWGQRRVAISVPRLSPGANNSASTCTLAPFMHHAFYEFAIQTTLMHILHVLFSTTIFRVLTAVKKWSESTLRLNTTAFNVLRHFVLFWVSWYNLI